jgi:hypothetical protein
MLEQKFPTWKYRESKMKFTHPTFLVILFAPLFLASQTLPLPAITRNLRKYFVEWIMHP